MNSEKAESIICISRKILCEWRSQNCCLNQRPILIPNTVQNYLFYRLGLNWLVDLGGCISFFDFWCHNLTMPTLISYPKYLLWSCHTCNWYRTTPKP